MTNSMKGLIVLAAFSGALALFSALAALDARRHPTPRSVDRCDDICAGMGGYVHHVTAYKGSTYCHCMRSFSISPNGVDVQELVPR